jgi:hypothetical protein
MRPCIGTDQHHNALLLVFEPRLRRLPRRTRSVLLRIAPRES